MISTNELRIGNIVKDADGNICTIRSIDSERSYTYKNVIYIGTVSVFIHKYNGNTGKWIESLSPIHLTEELLLKCGFDTESIPYQCINGNVVLYYAQGDFLYKYTGTEIKYLHQLQNLYFALTGKELEIKF